MPVTKDKWIEITILTPPELTDALSNFLEEMGTGGVFQERAVQDSFNGHTVATHETIKATILVLIQFESIMNKDRPYGGRRSFTLYTGRII